MYESPLCAKTYYKSGWFKKHLEKNIAGNFVELKTMDADSYPVHCFLLMSLLLRDTCIAYKMGDGDRIVRNVKWNGCMLLQ